jgi:tripeptidyl-peptidase-1
MPPHQASAVSTFFSTNFSLPPPLSYNASGRGTPDVSVLGDNCFIISGGQWQGVPGTSCSAPAFAGMVTLLNNIRLEAGKTLGFLGPLLYQNPNAFTDIVVGNNDVNSNGYGWYTVAGWDPVTGLGTPNFGNLAEVVKSLNARDFANSNGNRIPVN